MADAHGVAIGDMGTTDSHHGYSHGDDLDEAHPEHHGADHSHDTPTDPNRVHHALKLVPEPRHAATYPAYLAIGPAPGERPPRSPTASSSA